MSRTVYGSLARIADLHTRPYETTRLDFDEWQTSDYVAGVVTGEPTDLYEIEDLKGHTVRVEPGDTVVGALGERAATLEGVGTWRAVQGDRLQAMTAAGLFGAFTSVSPLLPGPLELLYAGHLARDGRKLRMRHFAIDAEIRPYSTPTILIVGTSMSAGKTTTGRLVCRLLAERDYFVIGSKLTGAGRYKDILSYRDAGAKEIYDFVDAGLPSSIVDEVTYRGAIRPLLSHIESRGADFLVAEAGASPLEPYNGAAAIDELNDAVRLTILCASDPYAVYGVEKAFKLKPDLVAGPATNTSAAISLVKKLTGVPGINVIDPAAGDLLARFLADKLGVRAGSGQSEPLPSE